MRSTDTLLIYYAGTIFSTITILSVLRVTDIEVYLALFVLEFFIVSDLMSPGGPVISRRKNIVGIILVAIFAGMMFGRIIEVIMKT